MSRSRFARLRLHLIAAALLPTCCFVARGQTTGTITGQVFDPADASVVNATIEARNVDTGLTRRELRTARALT